MFRMSKSKSITMWTLHLNVLLWQLVLQTAIWLNRVRHETPHSVSFGPSPNPSIILVIFSVAHVRCSDMKMPCPELIAQNGLHNVPNTQLLQIRIRLTSADKDYWLPCYICHG